MLKNNFFLFLEDAILVAIFKGLERCEGDRKLVAIIILRKFLFLNNIKCCTMETFFLNKGF